VPEARLAAANRRLRSAARTAFASAASGLALAAAFVVSPASAETISGALAKAYVFNPELNAARAAVRAADETVAFRMSGYRPTVSATADLGLTRQERDLNGTQTTLNTTPRGYGVAVQQNIWNGNQTINNVRRAESIVLQSRENMRRTEQDLLANAAAAYMNVLRDTAILNLRRNNVEVLEQQLRQTRERFNVGEVTRTDVAQSEASLAQGNSDLIVAQSVLQTSLANYRQFIGEPPKSLSPAQPLFRLVPASLNAAIAYSQKNHPRIQAALHDVDSAALLVRVTEGQLYPTVNLTGSYARRWDAQTPGLNTNTASVVASLNIPIYEGGATYATIRQNKELLGQARLQADLAREQVRAGVVSAWGVWQNVGPLLESAQARVRAEEIALNGVREEARVGQRTTLDVLNAQQRLLEARSNIVSVQRERVVSSYSLLSSVGDLNARKLGLAVQNYDPTIHFDQVKGKWIGLRTPDGR
jgi:outer membrane protein